MVVFWLGTSLLLSPGRVDAACVQVEIAQGNLSAEDGAAIRLLASQVLADEGVELEELPCDELYQISILKLGASFTVNLRGPEGSRRGRASNLEELPDVFSQLTRALLRGIPVDTGGAAVRRDTVTQRQARPERVSADALWLIRVGSGVIGDADLKEAPVLVGFNYRYELDSFAVDATGDLIIGAQDESTAGGGGLTLSGLYFVDPLSNQSLFFGGGIGYGAYDMGGEQEGYSYSGAGLHARISGGFELLRASTIRFSLQLDVTLPFYDLEPNEDFLADDVELPSDTRYAPTVGLTLGIGWQPRPVLSIF